MYQSTLYKIAGVNLLSGNCAFSAEKYARNFGMRILEAGEYHAELYLENLPECKIFFSKTSEHCLVSPGSLTLYCPEIVTLDTDFFRLEQEIPGKYVAYLDLYGNRIWLIRN